MKTTIIVGTLCILSPMFAAQDYNIDGRADIAFYRPGSEWATVPVLFSNGNGSWNTTSQAAPSWANQPGVIAIPGDFNQDGRSDIAFHRPGSTWTSVPMLLSNGNGSWIAANYTAPGWANEPGVTAVPGDYNRDGKTDIAFFRRGSSWTNVPVLFSTGTGSWSPASYGVPAWANEPGVIAVPGDYNQDARTDLAFVRPGSNWTSVPVLFSNGNGSWNATNLATPAWANQPQTIAIPGDYNRDGRSDLAFFRPGSTWGSVPVLFSNGNGSWNPTNHVAPTSANQAGMIAVPGDYNRDGRSDLAFFRPGCTSNSISVLFSNGDGSWRSTSFAAPAWANQSGVITVPGDFNQDSRTDLAFFSPGSNWNFVPVLFSNGDGTWNPTNYGVPAWANQPGVLAVNQYAKAYNPLTNLQDQGDPAYDGTSATASTFKGNFEAWARSLQRPTTGSITMLPTYSDYARLQDNLGLTGSWDGGIYSGNPVPTDAYLSLRNYRNEVHGTLRILQPTLEFDGGFCGTVSMPAGMIPVHMTSTGPAGGSGTVRSRFRAHGTTTREVTILGLFTGRVTVSFNVSLENAGDLNRSWLSGTIDINAPSPCRDERLSVVFQRRNSTLYQAFGYR